MTICDVFYVSKENIETYNDQKDRYGLSISVALALEWRGQGLWWVRDERDHYR
jgi:hypothetical protein